MNTILALASLALAGLPADAEPRMGDLALGPWRATVECPGGEIPFGLELEGTRDGLVAWLVNGSERRKIDRIAVSRDRIVLHVDPYDSRLEATVSEDGRSLTGEWIRARGGDQETRLAFAAEAGERARFAPTGGDAAAESFGGRWRVRFSSSADDAVALFQDAGDGTIVHGTFLTTLGDYRFLAGDARGDRLRLSVFDGAHAFLFTARLGSDGTLAGDFWSRDSWHETWTATQDPDAALPDPFGLTEWTGAVPLDELVFPDLAGTPRSLAEEAFAGKARLIVLFGTWCPNCYDESEYLVELHERYADRGLSILGLAFEFGDDFARQAGVVRRYRSHHRIDFPILIAGTSDKAQASAAFPVLDRVRAYPTTLFLDRQGHVEAIYTGFSGPATGAAHQRLREGFEELVENLLARDS